MLSGNASDSGASHRCNAIWDRTICVGVLYATGMNVGSRTHYIDAGSKVQCPLIEGIALHREVDLVLCDPSSLEINSNTTPREEVASK
jgi:hypothetical protein